MTIYQAEKWCDDCGRVIERNLIRAGVWPSHWTAEDRAQAQEGGSAQSLAADSDEWPSIGHPSDPGRGSTTDPGLKFLRGVPINLIEGRREI